MVDFRNEHNSLRTHEAIARNVSAEIHLVLADLTIPTLETEQRLTTA